MFDSKLTYRKVRNKFCWQASKRLGDDNAAKDRLIIKDYMNKYGVFFGKIVRDNKNRFIIIVQETGCFYLRKWSGKDDKNFTSRRNGCSMEWQQSEPSSILTTLRRPEQKEVARLDK
ncbi:hypothetical protein C1646_763460 [Rhizophagus diaphanus]|nr:hypothetical protein C1646_763460 [Rhizophagus diaphanus] [Rhizophagus sp. MUCL 43196]